MFSVTQFGKKLNSSNYNWNEETLTFFTKEDNLVLDFSDYEGLDFWIGSNCNFTTGSNCYFDTLDNCKFDTGGYCIFHTGSKCTFDTDYDCTFNTTGEDCVIIRRDIFEVINLVPNQTIKLNNYGVKGYTVITPKENPK